MFNSYVELPEGTGRDLDDAVRHVLADSEIRHRHQFSSWPLRRRTLVPRYPPCFGSISLPFQSQNPKIGSPFPSFPSYGRCHHDTHCNNISLKIKRVFWNLHTPFSHPQLIAPSYSPPPLSFLRHRAGSQQTSSMGSTSWAMITFKRHHGPLGLDPS